MRRYWRSSAGAALSVIGRCVFYAALALAAAIVLWLALSMAGSGG